MHIIITGRISFFETITVYLPDVKPGYPQMYNVGNVCEDVNLTKVSI